MSNPKLTAIAADLERRGLQPVIDHELDLVRAECPDCHAGATDPAKLWRPLEIAPRAGLLLTFCYACRRSIP